MTESDSRPTSIHPNKQNFVSGLDLIFDRWVAFRMALEMEWGGHDTHKKAEEFKTGLVDYFDREGKNIEREDIEDILLEIMSTEFSTLLEDESERDVANTIWTLYHESIKGKTSLLESLRQRAAKPLQVQVSKTNVDGHSSSDDQDDDGSDDAMEE